MLNLSKIVVAIDFSENSDYAFSYALQLAKDYNAKLYIIHIINEPIDMRGFYLPHITFDQLEMEIEDGAKKMMTKFCSEKVAGFDNFESVVETGIPCDEIVRIAKDLDASLIVLGTHGRTGLDHIIFGSTAERVVRTASTPVLTVRAPLNEG